MARLTPLLAALVLAAGCGGDDDESDSPDSGAPVERGRPFEPTVGTFISKIQPEKQKILEVIVAHSADCRGVEVDPGFVLLITAKALDADPDHPLVELVQAEC